MRHTRCDWGSLGLTVPDIRLPAPGIDLTKWAVVACDQYTSEPDYWAQVRALVGDAPSTYHITFPEVYLAEGYGRVADIQAAMAAYRAQGVFAQALRGFVLVARQTQSGTRLGLVLAVDLEQYDFTPGAASLIRPTEGTILARIPPRVRIRQGAPLETPHVMLLVDDPAHTVVAPLYAARAALPALYDVALMQGGGGLRGWAVTGDALCGVADALEALRAQAEGLLFAVGDGNHSLATARQCWLDLRDTLTPAQRQAHPARYALAELVNLHDPSLCFEAIHRVLFHVSPEALLRDWRAYAAAQGIAWAAGEARRDAPGMTAQALTFVAAGHEAAGTAVLPRGALILSALQAFLDAYAAQHPAMEIDYIHGEEALRALCAAPDTAGFLLPALDKADLFPAVRRGGVLPRKTFSMGEAHEKRYYMECREILSGE